MSIFQILPEFLVAGILIGSLIFLLRRLVGLSYVVALGYSGCIYFLLFVVGISVPYYLQGFSTDVEKCVWYLSHLSCPIGPAASVRGWTNYSLVDPLSYFLSGDIGFALLISCILALSFGKLLTSSKADVFLRAILITSITLSVGDFHKYAVINYAIE